MLDSHNMAGSRLRSERTAPRTDNHSAARIANRDIGPEIDESADYRTPNSAGSRLQPALSRNRTAAFSVVAVTRGEPAY